MPADNGPYETARQARAAAHAVVAPETGRVILDRGGNIRLLFLAIEDTGIVTASHENRIASWLADYEDSTMAVIAGWIRRAYEAGKAAGPDGTVTEWGVHWEPPEGAPNAPVKPDSAQPVDGEDIARIVARIMPPLPGWTGTVMRRQVTPWKEAPDE